jgi:hypothetical protein
MRIHRSLLLVVGFLGCHKGPSAVNPEPAANSLQLLSSGDDATVDSFFGGFDRAGRLLLFSSGTRRFDPDRGGFEAIGADLGGSSNGSIAPDDAIYSQGYRFDPATGFWNLLPPISGNPLERIQPSAATAIGDESGNLYELGPDGGLFRLPAKATSWEGVTVPMPGFLQMLQLNPSGHGVVVGVSRANGAVPFAVTSTGPATPLPAGILPVGVDPDGTGWSMDQNGAIIKISPSGSVTVVSTPTNPLGVKVGPEARDARGNFYAEVADDRGTSKHVLRLAPGATAWEDLATTPDLFDYIRVRSDGLVLVLSSPTLKGKYVYEVYKTGAHSLLPDAHESGVQFNPATVTLFPGQSVRIGMTLSDVTSLDGLLVSPAPGLKAEPKLALSVHGAAGALVLTAADDATPGPTQITVKSPKGQTGILNVTIAAPARPSGRHHAAHTLVAGNVMLAVRSDGTVWSWPGARDDRNPTGTAHPVAGISGARSVALDSVGYGPAYAVRVDGSVWAFNTSRPDVTPFIIPGLSNIAAVAAGKDRALFLDESGQVWFRTANQNLGGVNPSPPMRVPELTEIVALAPEFLALRGDGTVIRWDPSVTPPLVKTLTGLGAVVDVAPDFVVTADGALVSATTDGDVVLRTGFTATDSRVYTYPVNGSLNLTVSAALSLRADGTAWDGTVGFDSNSSQPIRYSREVAAPQHLVAVATSGYGHAVLLADGTVYQARTFNSLEGASDFARVPGLDRVLLPTGGAASPDFDLAGPDHATIVPGGTADVPVSVIRMGGFNGDIAVSGLDLPAGLSLTPVTIPAAATTATLHFTASTALVRFSRLAVGLNLTSGALSRVAHLTFATPITSGFSHPTFAIGGSHGVAVKADGTVVTWGSNIRGELGLGASDSAVHGTATAVPGLSGIVAVAAGGLHALALDSTGKVFAWGDNGSNQCGGTDGATILRPRQVVGLPSVKGIAASGNVSMVLAADGSVWALRAVPAKIDPGPYVAFWFESGVEGAFVGITATGSVVAQGTSECNIALDHVVRGAGPPNFYLALRDDLTVSAKEPGACAPIAHPEYVSLVALTSEAAVVGDGTVVAYNTQNSGTGTFAPPTPTAVPGITGAVDIVTAGFSQSGGIQGTTAVLLSDGTVVAFGKNQLGQAGSPVAASGLAIAPQPIPGAVGIKVP